MFLGIARIFPSGTVLGFFWWLSWATSVSPRRYLSILGFKRMRFNFSYKLPFWKKKFFKNYFFSKLQLFFFFFFPGMSLSPMQNHLYFVFSQAFQFTLHCKNHRRALIKVAMDSSCCFPLRKEWVGQVENPKEKEMVPALGRSWPCSEKLFPKHR